MPSIKSFMDAHRFKARLKEEVDSQVCITELVRCRNAKGKAFFAYIRIKPSEYTEYRMKLDRGMAVNPNHYEIIEYGWGEDPPAHLQEAMEEKYGVDHAIGSKMEQLEQKALQAAVG